MIDTNHTAKTARILKLSLILAIIIVLNLFFNYAVSLLYKTPTFEAFCPIEITSRAYTDKSMCIDAGGQWNETTSPMDIKSTQPISEPVAITGYCDVTYTCGAQYNDAQSLYNRNVFIIFVILGMIALTTGFYMMRFSVVALGFSLGGVTSLLIGAMRYWSDMQDWLRVAVLAAALVALIWLGIKKIKDE